jgi:hypothetical protein
MMISTSRQHSVVALLIGGIVLSSALGGLAFAQFMPKMDISKGQPVDPAVEEKRKEVDREYQSKLKTIPNQPQKKTDPWSNLRGSNSPQKQ